MRSTRRVTGSPVLQPFKQNRCTSRAAAQLCRSAFTSPTELLPNGSGCANTRSSMPRLYCVRQPSIVAGARINHPRDFGEAGFRSPRWGAECRACRGFAHCPICLSRHRNDIPDNSSRSPGYEKARRGSRSPCLSQLEYYYAVLGAVLGRDPDLAIALRTARRINPFPVGDADSRRSYFVTGRGSPSTS